MKLRYMRPRIHPRWGRFQRKSLYRYQQDADGVSAVFPTGSILPHYNHIEMTGLECSVIASYRIRKDRRYQTYCYSVFPQCRVNPNETRSSLSVNACGIRIAGLEDARVVHVRFDGMLHIRAESEDLRWTQTITAARDRKAVLFVHEIRNDSAQDRVITVHIPKPLHKIRACYTVDGQGFEVRTTAYCNGGTCSDTDRVVVGAGQKVTLTASTGIDVLSHAEIGEQLRKRQAFLHAIDERLIIDTPDARINAQIRFCKRRASESILQTKNGYMHAPGGGNFYAAMWTNDQCEYVNPLFAYLGYDIGQEQSVNCYRLFGQLARRDRAIYTSIIACGDGEWHGAGDRGDNAMYLYGLSRYLLTTGDRALAEQMMPYILTALDYQLAQFTDQDILRSDSDELENRFRSGNANLSTQCIAYDALISLSDLFADMGMQERREQAEQAAQRLRKGMNAYFADTVEGYATYRYCADETRLRSWICLPLTVGIFDRADGTVRALLSDKLLHAGGVVTRSGERTYWDRSTLYTIKGLFCAGYADEAHALLERYTRARICGEHAPYPVEAYPEGNAAQLSAESGLYVRIFTEGMLGYRPRGFARCSFRPALPSEWQECTVSNMRLGGQDRNIRVRREADGYVLQVDDKEYRVPQGHEILVEW